MLMVGLTDGDVVGSDVLGAAIFFVGRLDGTGVGVRVVGLVEGDF